MSGGALLPPEVTRRPGVWLLRLRWAGQDWYLAESRALPTDDAGVVYPHDGTLQVGQPSEALGGESEIRSWSMTLLLPGVDVALQESRGLDLSTATGELSRWVPGTSYDRRRVILAGRITAPEVGAKHERIRVTLEQATFEDRALLPPLTAQVTTTTWPDADPAILSRYYPWVYGTPGVYVDDTGTTQKTKGSPGLLVSTDSSERWLLIAGHEVAADNVRVYDVTAGTEDTFAVSHQDDGAGRKVAYVQLNVASTVYAAAGHEYWVCWEDGGGHLTPNRETLPSGELAYITRGDQVVRWLLDATTTTADLDQVDAAADLLQSFRFGGYIEEPVSPLAYLQEVFLAPKLLPVTLSESPRGLKVYVWRLEASSTEDLVALDGDPASGKRNCWRRGGVRRLRQEIVNELTLDFALDAREGTYLLSSTVSGDPELLDAGAAWGTIYSAESFRRYNHLFDGRSASELVETAVIWDRATAELVLAGRMMAEALLPRVVEFDVAPELERLRVGARVSVNEPDLHLVSLPGLVLDHADGLEGSWLTVRLLEDPGRVG